MLYRVFDAAELPALVSAFMDGYEVVAPVKRGAHYSFEAISSPDEMDLAYDTTLASPKRYFLPPTETLMRYNAATNEVADFQEEVVPRVSSAPMRATSTPSTVWTWCLAMGVTPIPTTRPAAPPR